MIFKNFSEKSPLWFWMFEWHECGVICWMIWKPCSTAHRICVIWTIHIGTTVMFQFCEKLIVKNQKLSLTLCLCFRAEAFCMNHYCKFLLELNHCAHFFATVQHFEAFVNNMLLCKSLNDKMRSKTEIKYEKQFDSNTEKCFVWIFKTQLIVRKVDIKIIQNRFSEFYRSHQYTQYNYIVAYQGDIQMLWHALQTVDHIWTK